MLDKLINNAFQGIVFSAVVGSLMWVFLIWLGWAVITKL